MKTPGERKRKMLLFLPLLILPFLALGFYALGGGKGEEQAKVAASTGINTQLPGAQLKKDAGKDKMGLYDQAQRDSASERSRSSSGAFAALGWDTSKLAQVPPADANANQIKARLAQIDQQLKQPPAVTKQVEVSSSSSSASSPDIERLEKLLKQKQQTSQPDPELQQLSGMLDKIMQIQNPGLAKPVPGNVPANVVKDSAFKAISAVIKGNQKVAPGGVVNLQLTDTLRLNGMVIPKGQVVSGLCNVTNQRLLLDIRNIRLGTSIIPVNLTVFALDGMAGVPAPEADWVKRPARGPEGQ